MKSKIVLCILMIFMLFTMSSCKVKNYSRMEEVYYNEILSKSSLSATKAYYVLVYRTGCAVCEVVEPYACEYANIVKKYPAIDKIYVLNKSDKKNNGGIAAGSGATTNTAVGATNYTQIKLATAPVLLKIKSGRVVAMYDTKTKILEELNSLLSKYE